MLNLNSNDLVVLNSIIDKENNLGLCEARGMTKDLLVKKTELSLSTINRSIEKLLANEYISKGIKQVKKHSFYITQKGYNKLNESLMIKIKED